MTQRYIKIKDHENLVLDNQSGAILNTDINAAARHNARLANLSKDAQREKDIDNLKKDVGEIKEMLQLLLSSFKNKE